MIKWDKPENVELDLPSVYFRISRADLTYFFVD